MGTFATLEPEEDSSIFRNFPNMKFTVLAPNLDFVFFSGETALWSNMDSLAGTGASSGPQSLEAVPSSGLFVFVLVSFPHFFSRLWMNFGFTSFEPLPFAFPPFSSGLGFGPASIVVFFGSKGSGLFGLTAVCSCEGSSLGIDFRSKSLVIFSTLVARESRLNLEGFTVGFGFPGLFSGGGEVRRSV
jgi:hypothetical protein